MKKNWVVYADGGFALSKKTAAEFWSSCRDIFRETNMKGKPSYRSEIPFPRDVQGRK